MHRRRASANASVRLALIVAVGARFDAGKVAGGDIFGAQLAGAIDQRAGIENLSA